MTIVGQDVDLLVLLTALTPENREIFFLKPSMKKKVARVYSSLTLQKRFLGIRKFILLAHAFGGADTTSSSYSKGKK